MTKPLTQILSSVQDLELVYAILNAMPNHVFVKDEMHRLIFVNDASCAFFGFDREERLWRTEHEIYPPEIADYYYNKDQYIFDSGLPTTEKEVHYRADGTKVVISISKQVFQDTQGKKYLIGIGQEIQGYKSEVQQEIKSDEAFKDAVETGFGGFAVFDLFKRKFVDCNEELQDCFGVDSQNDFINTPFAVFLPRVQPNGQSAEIVLGDFVHRNIVQQVFEEEIVFQRRDGGIFHAQVISSVLPKPNDHLAMVFFKNLSQYQQSLKFLEEKNNELERYKDSNAQLENFAYVASHDLREPLRTIGEFTQLLKRKLKDTLDGETSEFMDFIVSGVKNMNILIHDLLAYSRVNQEELVLDRIPVSDLILEVQAILSSSIRESNAQIIEVNLPEYIIGSYTKLKQLLQNLIANAIKFRKADENPCIRIACQISPTHWTFKVQDNGIGISPEFHDQIFHLFRKLHGKYEYQGSGIGLAICKKIMEQHGGEIWVESELGVGATFCFSIPIMPEVVPAG